MAFLGTSSMSRSVLYLPKVRIGDPTHYHHFLFGHFLPVLHDLDLSRGEKIYMPDVGPMNAVIESVGFNVYSWRKPYVEPIAINEFRRTKGFDGRNQPLPEGLVSELNRKIDKLCDIPETEEKHILLVDRGKPLKIEDGDNFIGTRGAQRRTIINIEEAEDCLKPYGKVIRTTLGRKTLPEQVSLFRNAWMIVAQHGAALSNVIFATNCEHVIEFETLGGASMASPRDIPKEPYVAKKGHGPWFNSVYKEMKIKPHYLFLKNGPEKATALSKTHVVEDHNFVKIPEFRKYLSSLLGD